MIRSLRVPTLLIPAAAFAVAAAANGEDAPVPDPQRLREVEERIESLEAQLHALEQKQAQTVSANPVTVLNPTITVFGDVLFRADDRAVLNDAGDRIDDIANLREAELDFRAAVDPYVDAVGVLALASETPGKFDAEVEEIYAAIKSLPVGIWETPPLGTTLKIGRFRTESGVNNRLHLHDLPQVDRPMVVGEFLSAEGFVANGISATAFLPSPGDTALRLTGEAVSGGSAPVAQEASRPAFLSNLSLFMPLGEEHSLNVALIGIYGTNDPGGHRQSRVGSFDFFYRWKPSVGGNARSFLVGGQAFAADHEFPADTDADGVIDASGGTRPQGLVLWSQFQADPRLYLGVRWDRADVLDDDTLQRRQVSPYLTWYTSEFFRVRAAWEHTESDMPAEDGLDTYLLEVTFVFGAHPPEPFWVNR